MKELFKSNSLQDRIIDAVESLKFDVQYAIQAAMKSRNVSQKELAQLMGCSASNISQMLAAESNPNLATVAKALTVLDEKFAFASETLHGSLMIAEVVSRGNSLEQLKKMGWVNDLVKEWGKAMNDVDVSEATISAPATKINRVNGPIKATMWTENSSMHAGYQIAA